MARGLSGFRLHPLYYPDEPSWLDAPANDALWAAAEETGAILQVHMWPKHAPALARMIERHPRVRVIVDHLGKPDTTEAPPYAGFEPVLRLADFPLTWVKIGDYQIASREEYPWRDTWPFVELLRQRFGAGRMLWGTGYPRTARLVPLAQALRYVQQDLPFSDARAPADPVADAGGPVRLRLALQGCPQEGGDRLVLARLQGHGVEDQALALHQGLHRGVALLQGLGQG